MDVPEEGMKCMGGVYGSNDETDVPETDGAETDDSETDVPETDGPETDVPETEDGGDGGRPSGCR